MTGACLLDLREVATQTQRSGDEVIFVSDGTPRLGGDVISAGCSDPSNETPRTAQGA